MYGDKSNRQLSESKIQSLIKYFVLYCITGEELKLSYPLTCSLHRRFCGCFLMAMAALSAQPRSLALFRDVRASVKEAGGNERLLLPLHGTRISRRARAVLPPTHRHHSILSQARRGRHVNFAIRNGPGEDDDSSSSFSREKSGAVSLESTSNAREDVVTPSNDNVRPTSPQPQNLLQSFQSTVKAVGSSSKWVPSESLEAVPGLIRSASDSISSIQDFNLQDARERMVAEARSLPSRLQKSDYRQMAEEATTVVLQAYRDWWIASSPWIKWPAVML